MYLYSWEVFGVCEYVSRDVDILHGKDGHKVHPLQVHAFQLWVEAVNDGNVHVHVQAGRALCLEYTVSLVRVQPEAAQFSLTALGVLCCFALLFV